MYDISNASLSLKEVGFTGRQETLFVEKVVVESRPIEEKTENTQKEITKSHLVQLPSNWQEALRLWENAIDEVRISRLNASRFVL